MSGWVWLAVGIAAWFAAATGLALIIGKILRKHGRDPDRSWMERDDDNDDGWPWLSG